MPRRKLTDVKTYWNVGVPKALSAEIELMLYDPFLGQAKFGAKSALVVQLLQEWVATRKAATVDMPLSQTELDL